MKPETSDTDQDEAQTLTDRLSPFTQYLPYALLGALVLALAILFLPHIQWVAYTVTFGNPGITQWVLVAIAIGLFAFTQDTEYNGTDYSTVLFIAAIVIAVGGLFAAPVIGHVYSNVDMAGQVESGVEEIDTLPNTSQTDVRVLPRSVADNYAESSLQEPQLRLSQSDLTYRDGDGYTWSYAIVPDNLAVSLFGNQEGAMFIDLTQSDKSVETTETTFQNGRGQIFTDSYVYRNVLHTPFKLHQWDTTFNVNQPDSEPYIAHSTIQHNIKFRLLPIPQLYSVPEHGSVQITSPDGSIESLTPEEAASSDRLEGQNFYPYSLTNFKVRSTKFSEGVINRYFSKRGVIEVASLPESGNNWPISVPTGDRENPELTYFVAAEPTGSGSGVVEVWAIDSQTGELQRRSYDDSQIGPQKAVDFVERQPEVNRLSNAQAVAPVPVTKSGDLYWHAKVIPESRSGILYTAFVNSATGDVTLVEDTAEVYAFMSEQEVSEVSEQAEQATDETDGPTSTVTVVITDENGEITGTRNITVPEGGNIQVDIPTSGGS